MVKLGIIGGGQLGYMLCEKALKIKDIIIYVYSDKEIIPCNLLKPKITIFYGNYDNKLFKQFLDLCDIITYEFESFNTNLLKNVSNKVYPRINKLEIIQDKLIQKEYLNDNNLNVGPFLEIKTIKDIYNFIHKYNYPIMIKARKGSFDGRGNKVIKNLIELENWLNKNKSSIKSYYIESFINFDNEISICGCLHNNSVINYEPVINTHKNNILLKTEYYKDKINNKIKNKIIETYHKIVNLFNTRGVICVEFFQKNEDIFINEIALRVHNSYHISLDCCNISQFDLHIMNLLNLNIPSLKFFNEGIMFNIISNMQTKEQILNKIKNIKNYKMIIKDYHKKPIKKRKIGHINIKFN